MNATQESESAQGLEPVTRNPASAQYTARLDSLTRALPKTVGHTAADGNCFFWTRIAVRVTSKRGITRDKGRANAQRRSLVRGTLTGRHAEGGASTASPPLTVSFGVPKQCDPVRAIRVGNLGLIPTPAHSFASDTRKAFLRDKSSRIHYTSSFLMSHCVLCSELGHCSESSALLFPAPSRPSPDLP